MEALHIDNITGQNSSAERPNDPVRNLAASSLIGDSIFNPAGETLGKIKDIMIDIIEAKISYVVIEFGGFLGISQKRFCSTDARFDTCQGTSERVYFNETKESFKRYPGFDKDHWPDTNSHLPKRAASGNDPLMGVTNSK